MSEVGIPPPHNSDIPHPLVDRNKQQQITYHGIYSDDGIVVFKGKKSVQEIKDRLLEFQYIVKKAVGNQHLQFTVYIWTNNNNLLTSAKTDNVKLWQTTISHSWK